MKNCRTKFLIGSFLILCLVSYPNSIRAEEKSLQWKEFFYACDEAHTVKVTEGHVFGAMEQKGIAVFENGEYAFLVTWFTYENVRGKSKYQRYVLYKFADGSTKFAKIEGSGTVRGEQQGIVTFLSGTVRFEAIQGSGTFTAVTPFRTPGAETYVEATATIKIPSK